MKKIIITFLWIIGTIFTFCQCNNFEDINQDPDEAITVNSSLIARQQIYNLAKKAGGSKYFLYDQMLAKYIVWTGSQENYIFNKMETASVDYTSISAGQSMVELASDADREAYLGLAQVLKVYSVFMATMQIGDVPYSEAGRAQEGIIRPKYDPQKKIIEGLLAELDEAYTHFSNGTANFEGDPIFNGDLNQWKKITTALQLKILINLSKKESDTDINVKEYFAKVVREKTLMESSNDNLQLKYQDKAGMYYPFCNMGTQLSLDPVLSSVLIDTLKKYEDYRLFYYAQPSEYLLEQGIPSDSWDAYIGVDPASEYNNQKNQIGSKNICHLNNRYIQNNAGEPVIKLGYAEQQFILAEAALRGWISNDPSSYYKEGIRANMQFIAEYTPADKGYEYGKVINNDYIQSYLNKEEIQLKGSFEYDLNKIITQKYLAGFMQYHWDAYFDYRRTYYPEFPINPLTSLNDDGYKNQLPTRWRYDQDQYDTNRTNLEEALSRQFANAQDSNNELIWILK